MSAAGERSLLKRAWEAADERYQLSGLVEFLKHKEVPRGGHSTVWYYFGGVTLFFFLVQIATGILLLMYYQVGEATSYESMKYLVGHVPFGWLIRSVHCWSAHLMTISLVIHLLSVLFTKAYRKPRELTWFTGCILFALALAFGFSGYLLPWNELSYFATAVGTDSVKSIPVVGHWMLRVLRGGEEVSAQTLYRFFALHVCILPLVIFGLIGVHLLFVQRQGMAESVGHVPEKETRRGLPFFPNFALRDALLWVLCINVLAILAVLLPYGPGIPGMEWELGQKADPLKPAYPGIKPEWYFLAVYQMLREFPAHIFGMEGPQAALLLVNVLMAVFFLYPVLDRKSARGERSPYFTDLAVGTVLMLTLLTLKAWDLGVSAPKGTDPYGDPALAAVIARTAALLTIGLGIAINVWRWSKSRDSVFVWSGAALLQAALHGLLGMTWLGALGVSAAAVVAYFALRFARARSAAALLVAALAASGTLVAQGPPTDAPLGTMPPPGTSLAVAVPSSKPADEGHVPEAQWPEEFGDLFAAKEVPAEARERFRALPSHAQALFFASAKSGMLSSGAHLATLLGLDVDNKRIELLIGDNCFVCHTNPDLPDEILFKARPDAKDPLKHLDVRDAIADVHFRKGLLCSGCHGGKPTDTEMSPEIYKRWPAADKRKADPSWIPEFCARCHSSSEFMRGFNPSLPVDQLDKYRTSKHGELLLAKKDPKPAQCVSCHGVHGIRGPTSPVSLVYPANIPQTCGRCHADAAYMKGYVLADGKTPIPTDQLEKYRTSVHGNALLVKHDAGAPACNDCHGNHAALPPETAHVSQVCRQCHVNNGTLFDGSPHKKAFEARKWPECATCHGTHGIAKPKDEHLGNTPESMCTGCHRQFGTELCDETAEFFRASIVAQRDAAAKLEHEVERLGERGFDLDDLRFQEASFRESLGKTRQAIHSFDRSDFTQNLKAGEKELNALQGKVERLWSEYRYRRGGLLLATALISLFALLLWARIRQADRDAGLK